MNSKPNEHEPRLRLQRNLFQEINFWCIQGKASEIAAKAFEDDPVFRYYSICVKILCTSRTSVNRSVRSPEEAITNQPNLTE